MNDIRESSRRDFLKRSSAVVTGGALIGSLNIVRSAHAQGSDEMKIALIGCGGRGNGAAANCLDCSENVKLVAVADAFEEKAKASVTGLKKKFGDKVDVPQERIFAGFDACQKAIACDIDMVVMASPPSCRPAQYKAAIEAGKHVFMEKPLCVDAPGFRSLLETNKLADQKGLKVGVGLQRHHQLNYLETMKRVHDGAIGELMFLRAYWNGAGVWVRSREALAKRWGRKPTEMEYQVWNWYYFVWLSGDHICEQHVHNLDVCNWVKGEHPVEANGMGGRQVRTGLRHNNDVGQIYDHHSVEFTYADGTKMFSQCRHIPGCWNNVSESAHGTKGTSNLAGVIDGENKWRLRTKGRTPYEQEHVDLMAAILNDKPYNEGHYSATSSFTAVLGRMATYSGKVVKWDDAVKNGPSEMPEKYAWDANPPVLPDENGSYEHAVAVPGMYKPY